MAQELPDVADGKDIRVGDHSAPEVSDEFGRKGPERREGLEVLFVPDAFDPIKPEGPAMHGVYEAIVLGFRILTSNLPALG